MHKILVTSDSHGSAYALCRVAETEPDAEAMIFLGDGLRDLDGLCRRHPSLRVYSVRGNCDLAALEAGEGLAAFGGVLFFYSHGDRYGVKYSREQLAETAKARGADAALYGHTHTAACERIEGVTVFNPGSVGQPRHGSASYGVITIQDGKARFEHREVPSLWDN